VSQKTQLLILNPLKTSFYRFLKIGQITLSRGPKGGSHESKMRGGGPKLFCSPYFSIGASLVLVIMTIKYYSLSSSYDDLLLKVSVFQNQLKLTASNMRNLDASLTRKEDALNECIDEKKTVQERNKNLDQDLDKKLADLVNLQGANDDANNLVRKLKDNIDKCSHDNSTMLEELKYLRRRNEELSYNDKECQANKAKINQLEGELNTLKDQSSALHAQNIKLKQDSEAARNQPQGQLPDLDPGKVSIIQPALNGIIGHKEPILPRGDPNAERPQPQLHLDAPLHDDNAIREEIIKEEEAKENAIEDVLESESETLEDETPAPLIEPNQINVDLEKGPEIHDLAEFPVEDEDKPKPLPLIPHESFLAKKAKYDGKRPATETFLDLKLLKRKNLGVPGSNPDYENLDEDEEEDEQETEKAVLKLPPSLGDILSKKQNGSIADAQEIRNKLPVLDDQIKDYEEDFPNDKEKRDPALILQDPLARDQDDDARISDAIQNDFERKQHNWRNKLMP